MRNLQRLKKLHKLVSLQEHDVLIEFKEMQNASMALKAQMNDLTQHSQNSTHKLMQETVTASQINIVRKFNSNVEAVLEQLNEQLTESNKNFLIVAEKLKQVRGSIKSIEQLINRHQKLYDYQQQKNIQRQIEENINYTLSSQD